MMMRHSSQIDWDEACATSQAKAWLFRDTFAMYPCWKRNIHRQSNIIVRPLLKLLVPGQSLPRMDPTPSISARITMTLETFGAFTDFLCLVPLSQIDDLWNFDAPFAFHVLGSACICALETMYHMPEYHCGSCKASAFGSSHKAA